MSKQKEIESVRRQEQRRGKRPVDQEEIEKRKRTRADLQALIATADEREFVGYLINDLGLRPGSAHFEAALRVWREQHEGA